MLGKFGLKNSKLSILTENWHIWYNKDADSFSEFPTLNPFLGKSGLKKSKLFFFPENWHTHTYTYTQSLSKMLTLISILVFQNLKSKSWGFWFLFWDKFSEIPNLYSFFGQIWVKKSWIFHFAWKLVHRVSWGYDYKNTEQSL